MDIKKENKKLIMKKDRCLISISNDITLTQRKVYNALLFNTKKQLLKDSNKRIFEIELTELENILNIKNNRVFLKKEIKDLMDKIIEFDVIDEKDENNIKLKRSHFIASVDIESGLLKYDFSMIILQMIDNPNIFTLLELNQMNVLNSKFSLSLYEFLKDRKAFIPKLTITDCKKMLVGDLTLYQDIRDFKKRVLEVATKEITDKTDLIASYELIKNKNTYTHIKFNAIPKEPEGIYNKLEPETLQKLMTELNKNDSFVIRNEEKSLEFQIIDKDLIVITPAEHFKQWLTDNHFDNKIKNILYTQFNLIFDKVIFK